MSFKENEIECNKVLILGEGIKNIENIEIKDIYYYKNTNGIKYESTRWNEVKNKINENDIDTIIASKKDINIVSRLLWECNCLKQYCLTDTENPLLSETMNNRANELMWDSIAKRSVGESNSIKQTGWISSFTGEYFSEKEMAEYADNTYKKLEKYCKKDTTVLEIGVASGITCFAIAPLVKKYVGIDISKETIKCTQNQLEEKKLKNVSLLYGEAEKLEKLNLKEKFDVVIINSVIQYFPGYNYFINVIKKVIMNMSDRGVIFVGDVMDLSKKELLQAELAKCGRKNNKKDLYYSKEFMKEIPAYIKSIEDVLINKKEGNVENELTLYRYDVLFMINKKNKNIVKPSKMVYAIGVR